MQHQALCLRVRVCISGFICLTAATMSLAFVTVCDRARADGHAGRHSFVMLHLKATS